MARSSDLFVAAGACGKALAMTGTVDKVDDRSTSPTTSLAGRCADG
jgi:hypothetical protein